MHLSRRPTKNEPPVSTFPCSIFSSSDRKTAVRLLSFLANASLVPFALYHLLNGCEVLFFSIIFYLGLLNLDIFRTGSTASWVSSSTLKWSQGITLTLITLLALLNNVEDGLIVFPLLVANTFWAPFATGQICNILLIFGTTSLSWYVYDPPLIKLLRYFLAMVTTEAICLSALLLVRRLEHRLYHLSTTDSMTGTSNRRSLSQQLETVMNECRQHSLPACIAAIDIDHFKKVNDTFGHAAGDRVLVFLARILREKTREIDSVIRLGGDEFLVILPHMSQSKAIKRMETIQLVFEKERPVEQKLTLSIGVALLTDELCDEMAWRKAADQALYAAKNSGRNCVCTAEQYVADDPPKNAESIETTGAKCLFPDPLHKTA